MLTLKNVICEKSGHSVAGETATEFNISFC